MSWIEMIAHKSIAEYDRITADPRVRDIDHRIGVCDRWIQEEVETKQVESLTRLRLETNVLEDMTCALDQGKEEFRNIYLWRINGELGEYRSDNDEKIQTYDVSGGCWRFVVDRLELVY